MKNVYEPPVAEEMKAITEEILFFNSGEADPAAADLDWEQKIY